MVAATASISSPVTPASTRACSTTGVSRATWARPAISGTTPPNRACRSTWLDTTEESTVRPSSTPAAAASSHDVSMASTFIRLSPSFGGRRLVDGRPGDGRLDVGQPAGVVGAVDVVGPHDHGVLVDLGVVVLPDALGLEAETAVHGLGGGIGHPDLQGQVVGAVAKCGPGQVQQQAAADLVPLPDRVDGDGGHVALVSHVHQPGVADDRPVDPGGHA